MNAESIKSIASKPVVIGVVTLILGALIGVGAERYLGHRSNLAGKHESISASRSSKRDTKQPQFPDSFLPFVNDPWDPFREMRSLQSEMNEMFRRSISRFHSSPLMDPFKDDDGYSLSLDVRELKDRYEVRAFLPDAKASDAKVKLEGNQLEVEVTHRQVADSHSKNEPDTATEWGRYTQRVELAGNLKSNQMKVEHKEHELLITIPKA